MTSPAAAPFADAGPPSGAVKLFALKGSTTLGTAVAHYLGQSLTSLEERDFDDGEHKVRPLDTVDRRDVYIVHSLHTDASGSVNDKLCKLLFFIGALKDAGAARATAITPYLCYARKDRRTQPFDPVTTRYVASLFEAVGTDAVVALDVHNPVAFENAFRCRTVSLTAAPLFVAYAKRLAADKLSVVSPDPGGVKRAELFRQALEAETGRSIGKAIADKHRAGGVVSGDLFAGDVAGTTALVIDDLIATGTTLLRAARAAKNAGATRVVCLVTHALFRSGATAVLDDPAIDRFVVTDSVVIPPDIRSHARERLEVLTVAPLLGDAIKRLHQGRGTADLLAP
jgi:ribose-phosphate pyrophosphokinase